jgi:hypothetical protein
MRLGVVTLAFRCSIVGGHQEQATDEAKKIRWLTVEEATRDMPEARAIRVVDAASRSSASLPVRVHDGTHLL